jgi:hypothetical protein
LIMGDKDLAARDGTGRRCTASQAAGPLKASPIAKSLSFYIKPSRTQKPILGTPFAGAPAVGNG